MPKMSFLEQAREQFEKLKKEYKYNKANASREAAAKLQYERTVCRSQLEGSKKNVERVIREQSRNIRIGRAEYQDTSIQQEILHEAALSYLLLTDAIYALTTVSSYDSISYAYEVLDAAVEYMSGKPRRMRKLSELPVFRADKRNNAYAALTSKERVLEKENICEQIMATLIESGDIETCLEQIRGKRENDLGVRKAYENAPKNVSVGGLADLVNGLSDDIPEEKQTGIRRQNLSKYIDEA